ncbi:MAG: hypothetical protein Q8P24_17955 [Desulfobacterales bacterium]|nr:hypothetical protein [Desulfobacterales bacterium]
MLVILFLPGLGLSFSGGRGQNVFPDSATAAGAPDIDSAKKLYDDFNADAIKSDLWEKRETGLGSTVTGKDKQIFADAINNLNGDDGEAELRFKNSSFQAFQVDVKIVSFEGEVENCRVYLKGKAYNFKGRNLENTEGEVSVALYLRADGKVKYFVYACEQEGGCYEDGTLIKGATLTTVDPKKKHTLALGFDGTDFSFRVDRKSFAVKMDTITYPVITPGWRNPYLRSDARGYDKNRITVTFDNVYTGSVRSIMDPSD